MDLSSRFRSHYFHYLISIIIPTIITAVSIPLFRVMLGAESYGNFAIMFNSVLLCTATLSGWIAQSIFRFYPASFSKRLFVKQAMSLSFRTQLLFFLPVFFALWILKNDWLLALFFSTALFITSLQFTIVAVSQTTFLSKKNIYSEIIRTVSYLSVSVLLLKFSSLYYMYSLFIAIIFSYLLSFFYVEMQVQKMLVTEKDSSADITSSGIPTRQFLQYGIPLSLWFVFAYLVTLTDKIFMRHGISGEAQGNYQAVFDLISRSITLIISPVAISLFPLLTGAFERGEKRQIKKLVFEIILLEFAGFLLVSALYWWFGYSVLSSLVQSPNNFTYKMIGQLVIAGTFIWQIAIVVQKKLELQFKSRRMLVMLAVAYLMQLLFYFVFGNSGSELVFALGYPLTTFAYLVLISFADLRGIIKYRIKNTAGQTAA